MFRFSRAFATSAKPYKAPTKDVPDVSAFLTRIGRNMIQHKDQFPSWKALMHAQSPSMKNAGIDTRDRRYLLNWIENFNRGMELTSLPRGKKQWGGERKRRANRAAFYGRKKAEERESS